MKNAVSVSLLLALALIVGGCAHDETKIRSARELFQEATELAEKGKVEKAVEKFMEVRTYYPGDELARKALLATADLHYDEEDYASALQSYEEFRLLYPTDFEAGYSLYRIAMAHFNQIGTLDRDQTETVRSIQTFESFLSSYPDSPHAEDAKARLAEAKSVLAKHYVYIGKFYLKKKEYGAACKRFQYVREHYPNVPLDDDLDELISRSCKIKEQANQ